MESTIVRKTITKGALSKQCQEVRPPTKLFLYHLFRKQKF